MAKITKTQLKEIQKIIQNHMEVVMNLIVGDGTLSPQLTKKLKLPKNIKDLISNSYEFGKLSVLQGKDLSKMNVQEVQKLLKNIKLTKAEQSSVEFSKLKTQQYIDSLTQKITSTVVSTVIQSDLTMWETLKDVVPTALENNTARYKVIQELRERTGDWERDWHRVAHTEMWDAKLQGEAEAIANGDSPFSSKGIETKVYKRPAPNACKKCIQLYLESDKVTPKVFTLEQLRSNGTNQGKKQADWVPTLGVLHPNCQCPLSVMPDGTKFDKNGDLVPDV